MDTKLLSKVPTWNGDEDQWFEWSFAFRAYCVVSSLISSEDLERAAGSTTSLPLAGSIAGSTCEKLNAVLSSGSSVLGESTGYLAQCLKLEMAWKAGESFQHDTTGETPAFHPHAITCLIVRCLSTH